MRSKPPHPGKILRNEYFEPRGITITEAAKTIGVTRQALNNVVNGKAGVSSDMAVRLGRLLAIAPETIQQWQKDYELDQTRSNRARRNRGRSDSYLIGGGDLEAWADTIDARYTFPQLIRMLVRTTAGVEAAVDFATAEDAQRSGWDGLVENPSRNAYVPLGRSGWELSTEANAQGKADRDYEKRKLNPIGLDPKLTTFVAVSARKWGHKRQWVAEKRAEKFWANVLAYDAIDLEQWLELCPEVGIWLTTRIGRRPQGVQSLEAFWNEFRLSTTPPMTPDLLLAGRNAEVDTLAQWLEGGAGVFRILADSVDEALAFVSAVSLKGQESQTTHRIAQTIVATDTEQVRRLMAVEHQLTIGWRLDDPSLLGTLADEGHRAVLPLGRNSAVIERPDIELPRLGRSQFVAAIKDALSGPGAANNDANGEEEANRRTRKSGRSITVYRRLFASAGAAQLPPWATLEMAEQIIPILLAGSWNESVEADRLVLARLAGDGYDIVGRTAARWRTQTDSPVRRIGDTWVLTAPLDAWSLLARYLGAPDLERYGQVVLEVLGEVDPKLELAPNERWLANLHHKQFRHSDTLREGLAESLTLLDVVGEEFRETSAGVTDRLSHYLITQLLGDENNPNRWTSLSTLLPRLAEAAPEAFLGALQDDLATSKPHVLSLFEPEEAPLGGGGRHPHLLWALEILAWYPDYLSRTALLLAKLDGLAPEIKIVNHPRKSLSEIFCTWHRNTAASLDQRLDTIDLLLTRQPNAAWELLLTLLPKLHDVSGNVAQPRWRPKPELVSLTYGEIWRANDELIQRALRSAGSDGSRLSELLSEIASWTPEQRQRLISQMDTFSETNKDVEQRKHFWNKLRQFLSNHRAFPGVDWSLPESELALFDPILKKLEPGDVVESSLWLFDKEFLDLPNLKNRPVEDCDREAAKRRQAVVTDIFRHQALDGLLHFARRVKMPWLVGSAVAEGVTDSSVDEQILNRALADAEQTIQQFAFAFALRRAEIKGPQWSEWVLESLFFKTWSPEKQAEFCLCLPQGAASWQVAADLGAEVDKAYWRKVRVFVSRLNDLEAETAVQKLLRFGRPLVALEQAGYHPEKLSSTTLVHVLEAALLELVRTKDLPDGAMLEYYLERIFGKLRADSTITEDAIGSLEWQYLPLRRFQSPVTLHNFLQKDPDFFATVLAQAFRAEDETDDESPDSTASVEERRIRARMAWDLLDSWHTLPGYQRDGSFDPSTLISWVTKARSICETQKRSRIGDDRIGHLLASAPSDSDGAWPHVCVRDLIEEAESSFLEAGIHAGRSNRRGVYAKNPLEGGRAERELARQYRTWAKSVTAKWPRTARLLNSLADTYEQFGRSEDVSAERMDLE